MNGLQLFSPEGYGTLKKGIVYHKIDNRAQSSHVSLVFFIGKNAYLKQINRSNFEDGIQTQKIIKCENQLILPKHLSAFEGLDIYSWLEDESTSESLKTKEHLKQRIEFVLSVKTQLPDILSQNDPEKLLNKHARLLNPPQNEKRFRNWTLTYAAYGNNPAVLLPDFHNCGKWDRNVHAKVKQGAPSISSGKHYGSRMTSEMSAKCIEGFERFAKNGKSLVETHVDVIHHEFKCKTVGKGQNLEILSDAPFPTFNQFKYVIDKVYSVEVRQRILYGEARYRNSKAPSKGMYSQEVSNLGEKIYLDAYEIEAKPRGLLDSSVLPGLVGVSAVDALSGMILGLGFSFGSERHEGYRALLFSMAIDKQKFCALFGIQIEKHEWPSEGLPPHLLLDRGPGAAKSIIDDFEKLIPIRQLAPSYSGQSKATVETTHPKFIKLEGQPTYKTTSLTAVQLAKAEILRVLEHIKTTSAVERLDPSADLINVFPTPLGIWEHYDERFRNDCQRMSFDRAVRTFLSKTKFQIHNGRVKLLERIFYSSAIHDDGLFNSHATYVEGYVLDMCVRYVWIEWNGKLYELEAQLKIRGDVEDLYITLSDLNEYNQVVLAKKSALNDLKLASKIEYRERFKQHVGVEWHLAIKRVSGRSKTSRRSKQETQEVFSVRNF